MFAFKIWIIVSILFTAYGADLFDSDDDICTETDPDMCHTEATRHVKFPGNIEALDKMCPTSLARLSCLLDHQKKCGNVRPGSIDEKVGVLQEILLEACDKDSELHQEFADNLPCIKSLMNDHHAICIPFVEDAVDAIENPLFFKTDKSEEIEDYRKLLCLSESFSIACFAARAGVKCGSETKEFVNRIMDQVGIQDIVCQADIREEVKIMAQILQLEIEEKMLLGEIFSKK